MIVQFTQYGGAGPRANLIGTGEAWVFSNGQLVRGTWERAYPRRPTVFRDAAGMPIPLDARAHVGRARADGTRQSTSCRVHPLPRLRPAHHGDHEALKHQAAVRTSAGTLAP